MIISSSIFSFLYLGLIYKINKRLKIKAKAEKDRRVKIVVVLDLQVKIEVERNQALDVEIRAIRYQTKAIKKVIL